eukprot:CAMPEP_0180605400 /NCGR_PEP_ID=MMETSP1037_2-20121125/26592_1 /TAXON_ID=632150 /ORGANISM="Azadinium spinosum, Strain 3D9" /LENGTH=201 /DNA_ID=CAMNT_0022624501 /DNA_START=45 /DNA_END=650 /DNA_ORIENTATION=+
MAKRKAVLSKTKRTVHVVPPRRGQGLRALTLRGPELAAAILAKQKLVENRTWPVPANIGSHGGWLALHVGGSRTSKFIRRYVSRAWNPEQAVNTRWRNWDPAAGQGGPGLPYMALVGLIHVRGMHRMKRGERTANPWSLGPFCWEIDRAVPLDPPICGVPGKLLLWKVDGDLNPRDRARLYRALTAARTRKGLGAIKWRKP